MRGLFKGVFSLGLRGGGWRLRRVARSRGGEGLCSSQTVVGHSTACSERRENSREYRLYAMLGREIDTTL